MASCFKDPNRPPPRLGPPLHTPRPGDLTRGPRRNPQPDPHARAPPKPPPRPPIRDPDRDPGWDPGALPKISLAKANIPFQEPQKLAVAANWSLLTSKPSWARSSSQPRSCASRSGIAGAQGGRCQRAVGRTGGHHHGTNARTGRSHSAQLTTARLPPPSLGNPASACSTPGLCRLCRGTTTPPPFGFGAQRTRAPQTTKHTRANTAPLPQRPPGSAQETTHRTLLSATRECAGSGGDGSVPRVGPPGQSRAPRHRSSMISTISSFIASRSSGFLGFLVPNVLPRAPRPTGSTHADRGEGIPQAWNICGQAPGRAPSQPRKWLRVRATSGPPPQTALLELR